MKQLFRWLLESKTDFLTPGQRATHTYVIGQPGTGKSRALESWVMQDIASGQGTPFLEAGDLGAGGYPRPLQSKVDGKLQPPGGGRWLFSGTFSCLLDGRDGQDLEIEYGQFPSADLVACQ